VLVESQHATGAKSEIATSSTCTSAPHTSLATSLITSLNKHYSPSSKNANTRPGPIINLVSFLNYPRVCRVKKDFLSAAAVECLSGSTPSSGLCKISVFQGG
jgi:hypothetical protein